MTVLWVGHEAESFILLTGTQVEQGNAAWTSPAYERTGMRVARSDGNPLRSTPDWTAVNELWECWRANGNMTTGNVFWWVENAAGTVLARILFTSTTLAQFQITDGAGGWVNIGSTFAYSNGLVRVDLHVKGGNPGQIELYYGSPGAQSKVVDATGNYSLLVNMVRVAHGGGTVGGGFDNDIAHCIVQTSSTINTTSEIKPPNADGTDTDGGVGGWANVDELTYSDADFINLTAVAKKQSFKSAARTLTSTVVVGVTCSARAWYEPGGPTGMKPYLNIGGTRYYGPNFTLDVVPKGYQYTFQTNPATGVAFTAAEANDVNLQYGWEAIT